MVFRAAQPVSVHGRDVASDAVFKRVFNRVGRARFTTHRHRTPIVPMVHVAVSSREHRALHEQRHHVHLLWDGCRADVRPAGRHLHLVHSGDDGEFHGGRVRATVRRFGWGERRGVWLLWILLRGHWVAVEHHQTADDSNSLHTDVYGAGNLFNRLGWKRVVLGAHRGVLGGRVLFRVVGQVRQDGSTTATVVASCGIVRRGVLDCVSDSRLRYGETIRNMCKSLKTYKIDSYTTRQTDPSTPIASRRF